MPAECQHSGEQVSGAIQHSHEIFFENAFGIVEKFPTLYAAIKAFLFFVLHSAFCFKFIDNQSLMPVVSAWCLFYRMWWKYVYAVDTSGTIWSYLRNESTGAL